MVGRRSHATLANVICRRATIKHATDEANTKMPKQPVSNLCSKEGCVSESSQPNASRSDRKNDRKPRTLNTIASNQCTALRDASMTRESRLRRSGATGAVQHVRVGKS